MPQPSRNGHPERRDRARLTSMSRLRFVADSEMDRVDAQDAAGRPGVQPGRGQLADAEVRLCAEPPRLLAGLAHRLMDELSAHHRIGSRRHGESGTAEAIVAMNRRTARGVGRT